MVLFQAKVHLRGECGRSYEIITVAQIQMVQISDNLRYLYFQAEVQLRGECGRSYERGGAIPEVPG